MDREKAWAWVRGTVKNVATKENLEAAGRTAKEIGRIAVPQIQRSMERLVRTGWEVCENLYEKRYGSAAEKVLDFFVLRPVLAIVGLTRFGWRVVKVAGSCGYKRVKEGDLPPEDMEKLRRYGLLIAGTAAAWFICSNIYDDLGISNLRHEVDEIGYNGIQLFGLDSVDQLEGVEHGMLVDDSPEHLEQIIALGELDGDMPHPHIPSGMEHRDMAMRSLFLAQHGYDETPEGYEVHHIIPLCEGGADTPNNMILLREEDHDIVTAAHRGYYGWNG